MTYGAPGLRASGRLRSIDFRSEPLPLSGALQVLKRALRAPYWTDRERTIN